MPSIPSLQNVDHIHVYVTNRDAAKTWYADVLNFKPIAHLEFWAINANEPLTIGNPEGTINLALFERATIPCRSVIAFGATAEQFLAWRAHLAQIFEKEIEIFDHDVAWSLYFYDPDGNPFEITTHAYAEIASTLRKA